MKSRGCPHNQCNQHKQVNFCTKHWNQIFAHSQNHTSRLSQRHYKIIHFKHPFYNHRTLFLCFHVKMKTAIAIVLKTSLNRHTKYTFSPGLVVMGGGSRSEGRGFESRRCILDGNDIISHWSVVKIVMLFVWKDRK